MLWSSTVIILHRTIIILPRRARIISSLGVPPRRRGTRKNQAPIESRHGCSHLVRDFWLKNTLQSDFKSMKVLIFGALESALGLSECEQGVSLPGAG